MAKDKNFKINRNTSIPIVAGHIKVGDMFEKDGSLHMRVDVCGKTVIESDEIHILNINTGSVWNVSNQDVFKEISNCKIDYTVL